MLRTKQLFIHFLVGCSSPTLINLGCVCADSTLLTSVEVKQPFRLL